MASGRLDGRSRRAPGIETCAPWGPWSRRWSRAARASSIQSCRRVSSLSPPPTASASPTRSAAAVRLSFGCHPFRRATWSSSGSRRTIHGGSNGWQAATPWSSTIRVAWASPIVRSPRIRSRRSSVISMPSCSAWRPARSPCSPRSTRARSPSRTPPGIPSASPTCSSGARPHVSERGWVLTWRRWSPSPSGTGSCSFRRRRTWCGAGRRSSRRTRPPRCCARR
jgi:hypothetical protein